MKVKKLTALLLASLMAVSMTACGGSPASGSGTGTDSSDANDGSAEESSDASGSGNEESSDNSGSDAENADGDYNSTAARWLPESQDASARLIGRIPGQAQRTEKASPPP